MKASDALVVVSAGLARALEARAICGFSIWTEAPYLRLRVEKREGEQLYQAGHMIASYDLGQARAPERLLVDVALELLARLGLERATAIDFFELPQEGRKEEGCAN